MQPGEDITGTVVRSRILRDTYRDSVELMRVAAEIERLPGVRRAALLVGTPANRDVLSAAGLLDTTAAQARPGDLVVAVAGDDATTAEVALARATDLLAAARDSGVTSVERTAPVTLADAVAEAPAANLALISTPGPHATAEALKALKRGLHVFLFSNNVSVADELELKRLALRKQRLLMGPDCGTAILDGVPLGFANVVRRGPIGLVAASGTGLQQVVCLIDRLGGGVSQAIGVGGRDLDQRIGGLMTLVWGSAASAASPCSIVMPPISSFRSRPPVPIACETPPPRLWIRQVTSCKPVPDAATRPMSPRRTTLAKPSGTPLTIAVPQSGPITSRSRARAAVLIASSSAIDTLSENTMTCRPSAIAFIASAAA